MAGIAVDTVIIAGCQAGTVGRCGAAAIPALCAVAADTEVARAVKILLGDGQCGPEDRVTAGVAHRGAAPAGGGFGARVFEVVA
jgi:hypothetical protein